MTYTLADFCQGHGGRCTTCYSPEDACDLDHGVVSYCDGTCASAMLAFEDHLRCYPADRPAGTTDTVTLEVSADGGWRRYFVTFEGPDADAWAAVYITARYSTHSFYELATRPFDGAAFPQVTALLYPTCEHGMDAHSCYGPEHFMTRDQELALGLG